MYEVIVVNKTESEMVVPFSELVPGARVCVECAGPEEEASCIFLSPLEPMAVQAAILAWAHGVGAEIVIRFAMKNEERPPEPQNPPQLRDQTPDTLAGD